MTKIQIRKQQILVIGIFLFLLLAGILGSYFVLHRSIPHRVVVNSQDGKEVQRIAMDTVKNPHIIEITGEDGAWNRVWISEDSVKMESASCPDGLCVHQGAISDGLLPIVCLPNKVQIQIVEDNHEESSETEEFDAKVG